MNRYTRRMNATTGAVKRMRKCAEIYRDYEVIYDTTNALLYR